MPMFWFMLHKWKRAALNASLRVVEGIAVAAMVLIGGFGSSWYMVEAGSRLTTARLGPWVIWTSAARPDADPYTRAHFVHAGTLPVSSEVERTYVARTDDAGERLHSSCDYVVEGKLTAPEWWSLSVFDERGQLISNPAERYAFTRQTAAAASNGSFSITLAREARAGNWLPVGGAGRIAIVLNIVDQRAADSAATVDTVPLPAIRKVQCR